MQVLNVSLFIVFANFISESLEITFLNVFPHNHFRQDFYNWNLPKVSLETATDEAVMLIGGKKPCFIERTTNKLFLIEFPKESDVFPENARLTTRGSRKMVKSSKEKLPSKQMIKL